MIPIFFPYTYISNRVAEAVAACFGQFMVYQPLADRLPATMAPWVDRGIIDVRIPVQGNDGELASAVKNYMEWANLNIGSTGINPSSLKTLQASAPLLDPSLSSHVVAEVKKQAGRHPGDPSPDPLVSARVFLHFAQKFDQQSTELDNVLEEFEKKERDLIQDIKFEADALAAELMQDTGSIPDANTDYLIAERLDAWTRLLLKDSTPPGLFVTHRPAVLAHMLEAAPRCEKILDVETIPGFDQTSGTPAPWQDRIVSYLSDIIYDKFDNAATKKMPDLKLTPGDDTVALKIYLVPEQNALQLFCRVAGLKDPGPDPTSTGAGAINTLLGLIAP